MKNKKPEEIYNPKYVENLFDRMSESYERINLLFSFGFTQIWRNAMMNRIARKYDGNIEIIDLMTGMGETWDAIKKKYPESKLTGLDISEGMLMRAKKKNKKRFGNAVKLEKQNILESELESDRYDLVLSAFGLKTFNEEQFSILAEEVQRILKPKGCFVFIEISSPGNYFLNQFYKLYLGKITPIITKILLGDPIEYRMLWEYTRKFSNSKKVAKVFEEKGLKTEYDEYFFGCATGVHGTKE